MGRAVFRVWVVQEHDRAGQDREGAGKCRERQGRAKAKPDLKGRGRAEQGRSG